MPRLPLTLLSFAALAACGGTSERTDDAPVVVSAIGADAVLAEPKADLDTPSRILLGATAQGLVRFDATGQIEPGLAERWIVIDEGRSFIFRLRDAQWSDGERVSAAQVVRALRRAASPASRNALAPFLAVIDEIVEMTPQVIEVRLKHPRPDLLKLFAQPELAVYRTITDAGSGPFRITQRDDHEVLLRPVRDFPVTDADEPAPQETLALRGERAGLALARFKDGKSDLVLGGTVADWPLVAVADLPPASVRTDPAIGLFGLAVIERSGFLTDAANRQALSMAIDRDALTAAIKPDWKGVDTLLPAQLDSAAAPVRPEWAGMTLAERRASARARVAAYQRAHPGPVTLRLALPSGPGGTLLWAHLAASMRSIGAQPVRVGIADPADLRLIDAVAPHDSGRWFVATACVTCSETAARLIQAGRDAIDLPARAQRIAEAEAALGADAAYIPIAQPLRWSIVALRLPAWQGNSRAWHPLNHLRSETR